MCCFYISLCDLPDGQLVCVLESAHLYTACNMSTRNRINVIRTRALRGMYEHARDWLQYLDLTALPSKTVHVPGTG